MFNFQLKKQHIFTNGNRCVEEIVGNFIMHFMLEQVDEPLDNNT